MKQSNFRLRGKNQGGTGRSILCFLLLCLVLLTSLTIIYMEGLSSSYAADLGRLVELSTAFATGTSTSASTNPIPKDTPGGGSPQPPGVKPPEGPKQTTTTTATTPPPAVKDSGTSSAKDKPPPGGGPPTPADRRTKTDAGVDVSDPALYAAGVDWNGDSSTATVMGMATNYHISVYQRFVGSLRKSGFKGHIIIGVDPDIAHEVVDYFTYRNVTPKFLKYVNCTYRRTEKEKNEDIFQLKPCADPYPDIKTRWSRFPLQRDWLVECKTCTGPVLTTDVRDTIFQRDPFGPGSPIIKGLQVIEEHPSQTTEHWLTNGPIQECKGISFVKPMLCSGTTIGTRVAMIKYLEVMLEEMKVWIQEPKCRFDMEGDDQSIHNYLFYTGQLPFATPIRHRSGGIVNTAGKEGAILLKQNREQKMKEGVSEAAAQHMDYKGANGKTWIGLEFNLTNEDGLFTEADGTVSRVVHQWDRLGLAYDRWLDKQEFAKDPFPPPVTSNRRRLTDAGVDVSDPALYTGVDLNGDSSTATVMGMATNYPLNVYQRFIGSLRKSGFKGHIIIGVDPDISRTVLEYFAYRNATAKFLKYVNCTYRRSEKEKDRDIFQLKPCADPYPDIKTRWSRFPLQRDWLVECKTCTGPVLTTDVRDTIFQRDPFGPGSPVIKGLQVIEEHPSQTTEHWLTHIPIKQCKEIAFVKPMLCSGTTIGTRVAMIKYLEVMLEEMKVWIKEPNCRFDMEGDDQSIHNYLVYTDQLPFATPIRHRSGGIVNTAGKEGAIIWKQNTAEKMKEASVTEEQAKQMPYRGANDKTWIGLEFNLTNEDGLFTEADGSVSRVVHQWDRLGQVFDRWLDQQDFARDPFPPPK